MKLMNVIIAINLVAFHVHLFGMSDQEKQAAILDLQLSMRRAITDNDDRVLDWAKHVPLTGSRPLFPFLKKFNQQYALGFDTKIENIENGVVNPFENPVAPSISAVSAEDLDISEEEKQEDAIDRLYIAMDQTIRMVCKSNKNINKTLLLHDWDTRRPKIAPANMLAFFRHVNGQYRLGHDKEIQQLERDFPNAFQGTNIGLVPTAQAAPAAATMPGMNAQETQNAINALYTRMETKINLACARGKRKVLLQDWTKFSPIHNPSTRTCMTLLETMNKTHELGFDTEIQNIKQEIIDNPTAITQEDRDLAESANHLFTVINITSEELKNPDYEEPSSKKRISDLADSDTEEESSEEEEPSDNTNPIQQVTFTADEKRNARIPERNTQYQDDDTAQRPSFFAQPIGITGTDKRNLRGHRTRNTINRGLFKHLNSRISARPTQSDRPGYTTHTFLRSPLFAGFIILCTGGVIYHYWQKHKTEQDDADKADAKPENDADKLVL